MPLFKQPPPTKRPPRQRKAKDPKSELGNMFIQALKAKNDPDTTLRAAAAALDMDPELFTGPASRPLSIEEAESSAIARAIGGTDYGRQMAEMRLARQAAEIDQLRRANPGAEGAADPFTDMLEKMTKLQALVPQLFGGAAAAGKDDPQGVAGEIRQILQEAVPMVREGVLWARERQFLEKGINPYQLGPDGQPQPGQAPAPGTSRTLPPLRQRPAPLPQGTGMPAAAPQPAADQPAAEAPAFQNPALPAPSQVGPAGVDDGLNQAPLPPTGGENPIVDAPKVPNATVDFERAIESFEIVKSQNPADPAAAADQLLTICDGDVARGDMNLASVLDWLLAPGEVMGIGRRLMELAMQSGPPLRDRIQALTQPREWAGGFIEALLALSADEDEQPTGEAAPGA